MKKGLLFAECRRDKRCLDSLRTIEVTITYPQELRPADDGFLFDRVGEAKCSRETEGGNRVDTYLFTRIHDSIDLLNKADHAVFRVTQVMMTNGVDAAKEKLYTVAAKATCTSWEQMMGKVGG
jgi:hypothetical protein